jgi:catechol-2,3-dioxygenase
MKVLSLNHYNLRASRETLEVLRDFYTEVVGLKVGERPPFTSFGYWLYAGDQAVLHLGEARGEEQRPRAAPTTFDHAAFNCSGRREFERQLTRRGIKYDIDHVPQTGQVQLFFNDPAGNGVELTFARDDV